jgi:hypothetical protein
MEGDERRGFVRACVSECCGGEGREDSGAGENPRRARRLPWEIGRVGGADISGRRSRGSRRASVESGSLTARLKGGGRRLVGSQRKKKERKKKSMKREGRKTGEAQERRIELEASGATSTLADIRDKPNWTNSWTN